MSGNAYWKNRQARLMYGRMDDAEVAARSVARIYAKASEEITQQMRDIFRVYKDKWNLTEKEAKRLLSVMDDGFFNPESLRRGINTIVDVDLRNQMLRDLETPAYQARLRRLQELQDQIDQMMVDVYKQDKQRQTEHYINTGTDTYYRGIYDVQRQVGFQFSFAHIDQKAFDRLLKSKWSGQNYSTRIWENTQHVANTVKEELMLEMLTGKALDDCAESIQNRFQVGAFQSRRIIRTESNFVSGQMQLKSYEECGAEYYEYVATLDSKTDEECGVLDGKRFKRSEAQPGVNFHPMHPFCRCADVIVLDSDVKAGLERRARDPKTGKLVKVPASTNYIQWAKDNGLQVKQVEITNEHAKDSGSKAEKMDIVETNTPIKPAALNPICFDVTEKWINSATPFSHEIEDIYEFVQDGKKFVVDGKTVVLDYDNHEKEVAQLLREKLGGTIQMMPRVNDPDNVSTPDYLFRGDRYDLKTMKNSKSKKAVYNRINNALDQADNFILDISNNPLGQNEIKRQVNELFKSWHTRSVKRIIIIDSNEIIQIVERE